MSDQHHRDIGLFRQELILSSDRQHRTLRIFHGVTRREAILFGALLCLAVFMMLSYSSSPLSGQLLATNGDRETQGMLLRPESTDIHAQAYQQHLEDVPIKQSVSSDAIADVKETTLAGANSSSLMESS
jgi:hypothetical protein